MRRFFLIITCLIATYELQASLPLMKPNTSSRMKNTMLGNELLALHFPLEENPMMSTDAKITKGKGSLYYVTLPFSQTSDTLNMEILAPLQSTVKINGQEATKLLGDYEGQEVSRAVATVSTQQTIIVEITAASGIAKSYDILAQRGIYELDSIVYAFKEKYAIPGISFAIGNIKTTSVAYKTGYGYAIKENKTRVTPEHLFRLASMSKQHTAIAILKLIEDGYFGIDDYVFGPGGLLKDRFPTVTNRASRITVRHLLEHTSGFRTYPDYMFDIPFYGWSMEQRINAMLKNRQPNEPGSVFAYYNTGYGLLGYIIETVTGKTFEAYLQEVYAQVGIDDIHVGGTQAERRTNEVAYYGQNNANAEGMDMTVRGPAGGLIASTDQLLKLLWTLDGNPNVPDVICDETRHMMFTPSKTGKSRYALGWRSNHTYFPDGFYHGGTLAGVATFWVYSQGYVIVFLCNSRSNYSQFDNELYRMARDMIALATEMNLQ